MIGNLLKKMSAPQLSERIGCRIAIRAFALVAGLLLCAARAQAVEVLDWQPLPALPDKFGFAGPFAGVSGDALIVAGGANFPDGRPWTGAQKIWHDRIFVLDRPDGEWRIADAKLPRPLGYGVSLTTDKGIACLGGSDATNHYADAFLLVKVGDRIEQRSLPSLPKPVANFCGALLGNTIYGSMAESVGKRALSSSRRASPLRVATGGDASWRREARRRRSPACCWKAWPPPAGSGEHMAASINALKSGDFEPLLWNSASSVTHRFC